MASSAKKRSKGSKASDGKRKRKHSGSDEDEPAFLSSKYAEPPASKIYNSRFSHSSPAELFRKDLISAMKLPDSEPLSPDDYWLIEDPWKPEWEKGVQVPVNPEVLPEPNIRIQRKKRKEPSFKLNKKLIRVTRDAFFNPDMHVMSYTNTLAERTCRYDMDDIDLKWLTMVNEEREDFGLDSIEEIVVEQVIEAFEAQAYINFQEAIKSEEGLGVEYDEDAICDVCRSPDSHDGNEMVFCDSCNICVHQICYGITKIPEGSWICRTCALGIRPACVLCPNRGGAMKTTRCGQKWAHVGCAVWIPEVSFLNFIKMEPIIKVAHIPASRWALVCSLCKEKTGACIQCSEKVCKTAFHVTCAFKEGLQMRATVKNTDSDDDALKAYCKKHSTKKRAMFSDSEEEDDSSKNLRESLTSEERATLRQQKIHEKEAEFYNYVNIDDVAAMFQYDRIDIEMIFNYWKLKRKSKLNRHLLPPKIDTENNCAEEDSPFVFQKKLVHHRQDLERVRNLCFMVKTREKLTKKWIKCKEEIFLKQAQLLSEQGDKLDSDELEAVVNINIGDIAYEKKHCSENGYTPNMFSAVTGLYGEDTAKSIWVKSSRKSDRTKCEKTPNPYAKHYLNGVAKRSQRWFASVDKQRQSTHLPNNALLDEKSNLNLSFQSSSDHLVSDDGLELSKDYDDSLPHRTLFMSHIEAKYDSSCDNACANLSTYHDTGDECSNKMSETHHNENDINKEICFPAFTEIKSDVDCVSKHELQPEVLNEESTQLENKLDANSVNGTVDFNNECKLNKGLKAIKTEHNMTTENKHEASHTKAKNKCVSNKQKKCAEKSITDKLDLTSIKLDDLPCILNNDQNTENYSPEEAHPNSELSVEINTYLKDKECGSDIKISHEATHDLNVTLKNTENKVSFQKTIKLEEDEKLNLPVRVIVKSEVPLLTSENENFTVVIESNQCNKLSEKPIKTEIVDVIHDKCSDKTVYNKPAQNSNLSNKDKGDVKIRPFPNKDSPLRTQSPTSIKASENGVVKINKTSPKHTLVDKSQTVSKLSVSKLKHSTNSHTTSSVNKQLSSSSLTKCQEKNSSVSSKEDVDSLEQKDGHSHCKDASNDTPMPKKDMLRGYKIPKKSRSDKPEENSLDLKRGNSPLSPLPDITSSNFSGYHAKAKPSWRKLEPRPNKVVQNNPPASTNGDVNQEPEPRLVLKLKKDTSDPESQRWKTDPIAYGRSNMSNWMNDYQSMSQGLLPRPYLPVRRGHWSQVRNRGGYNRRMHMNYGNSLRYS